MIRVMVVDDEPLAREELARMIQEDKEFLVVSFASNGVAALEELEKNLVDVVFLDIEMPELDGLETASRLAAWETPPRVVFATAYHQYAVEAFDTNAIDYLLKPYEPSRLKKTLEKVRNVFEDKVSAKQGLVSLEDTLIQKGILKKIVGHIKGKKDRIIVQPDDIYFFHVLYSEILAQLEDKEIVVNSTLKDLSVNLDPNSFSQTHKSFIVNINKVEKVSPLFSGNFEVTLNHPGGLKVPLSRRYAKALKARLGGW